MPDSIESNSKFTPEELAALELEIPAIQRLPKIKAQADLSKKMTDPGMRGGAYSPLDPINQEDLRGFGVPNREMTAGDITTPVLEGPVKIPLGKGAQITLPKEPSTWERRATITDRSFNEYCRLLGIKDSDLKGKLVLDLGSGKKQSFAKEARRKGVNVVSVNPDLSDEYYRQQLQPGMFEKIYNKVKGYSDHPSSVAALAQELPLKDATFDTIVSVVAIPDYLPADDIEIRNAFSEMIRVLKPGGKAFLCSYSPPDHARTPLIEKNLLKLQGSGIQVNKQIADDGRGGTYNRIVLNKPK